MVKRGQKIALSGETGSPGAPHLHSERLSGGEVITRANLEGALKRQGIALLPGDAVLIHTGWGGLWDRDNEEFLAGDPGPGMEAVRWPPQLAAWAIWNLEAEPFTRVVCRVRAGAGAREAR
jgi:murein DD-endopeptidase MepM/ murein hydrolase activator NlpD